MSVPVRIVLERSTSQVLVAYDQDITRVAVLPWDTGFTLRVNTVPTPITLATKVANGIELSAPFLETDVVDLAYAGTNLVDAATSLSAVPTFTATAAPPFWEAAPFLLSAIIAQAAPANIVLTFRDPVASLSGDLKAALTMTIDAVAVPLTTATATGDGRTVTIATTADFSYNNVVAITYTPGDWYDLDDNTPVSGFTITATNASSVGTPESDYPLSTVIAEPLSIVGNAVTATFSCSLNSVDRELVNRYAPMFDQGGYFGLPTVNPPTGYFVPGKLIPVRDGQTYSYVFTIPGHTEWATLAAAEWLATMVVRVGVALNTARATDQGITLGVRTITQV
jgi:hypothetical protein